MSLKAMIYYKEREKIIKNQCIVSIRVKAMYCKNKRSIILNAQK